ncbi:hypothetical protein BSKO_00843 [Bryopsis sp. KO-2023]|nr:hypothetical protein BSKO_00843 [Bryopsis sp. KO-2023]
MFASSTISGKTCKAFSKFLLNAQRCKPIKRTCSNRRQAIVAMSSAVQQGRFPEPVVKRAGKEHKATVFMLHGLGDTGHGWADVASMWGASLQDVKFVFPTAPTRPITLNMGMAMPGWFDLTSLDKNTWVDDKAGMQESLRYLEGLIEKEIENGIPAESIAVAGFSQGGAVALLMLRSKIAVSGIVGMSTFLPLRHETPLVSSENAATPVLLCHGDMDQVLAYENGKDSFELLKGTGVQADFKTYRGMQHSACPEELEEVKQFFTKVLKR